MIAPLLDRPLRLERLDPQPDGRGDWIEGWRLVASLGGRLRPLRGREIELAGRRHAEVTHALYLPPGSGAAVGDRVVIAERSFAVAVAGLGRAGHHDKLLLIERREAAVPNLP